MSHRESGKKSIAFVVVDRMLAKLYICLPFVYFFFRYTILHGPRNQGFLEHHVTLLYQFIVAVNPSFLNPNYIEIIEFDPAGFCSTSSVKYTHVRPMSVNLPILWAS